MLSPAQKFRQQKLAAKSAQQAQAAGGNPYGAVRGSDYELLLANLAEHKRALSTIKAKEQKAEYKIRAVKDFDGWVDGVLGMGAGEPDPLFAELFAWNLDAGNFERALDMAEYAIKHNLAMPDQFKRAVPEFVMDSFFEAYNQKRLGDKAQELLARAIDITQGADAHDQPRAKLYKVYGYALVGCKPDSAAFKADELDVQAGQQALAALQQAFTLDDKSGVKKDMEKLELALKKSDAG